MTRIPGKKTIERIKQNRKNFNSLGRVITETSPVQLLILGQNIAEEMEDLMGERNNLVEALAPVVEDEQVAAEVNVPEEQVVAEVNVPEAAVNVPGSPNLLDIDFSEDENEEAEAGQNQEEAAGGEAEGVVYFQQTRK